MTLEEAITISKIISNVDGGCSTCVGYALSSFCHHFPQFEITMDGRELKGTYSLYCEDELEYSDRTKIEVREAICNS